MAQDAQNRVQNAMRDFINAVDRNHLRNMEREMHLCAADCCSNQSASINEVIECKERCEINTRKAQVFVQGELERFQESLSRCVLSCQDDIKDKVTPNTPQSEIEKYRAEFDACAIKCCDSNVGRLPVLSKKIMDSLNSGKY